VGRDIEQIDWQLSAAAPVPIILPMRS